jgi:hypothetical protein
MTLFALSRTALAADATPTLISGQILTPTINVVRAPASPELKLNYAAPGGLVQVNVYFTSANGQVWYSDLYVGSSANGGKLVIQNAQKSFSLYAQPGKWTLTGLALYGASGNTTYNANQLASLFPSVTLTVTNNGTPDTVPPSITSGKILTPTVSLSAKNSSFEARLSGSDSLSGIYTVNVSLSGPPGSQGPLPASGFTVAPLKTGSVTASWDMTFGGETGTWTITGCSICDEAGNCNAVTSAAALEQLFGTITFIVTK